MAKVVKLPEKTPIPTNWRWVDLGKLTETLSGYPFDSQLFSTDANGRRPLIRIRDVVRGYTETFTSEECSDEYVIHKDDILIGMDGDFNVQKWAQGDALLNQRVCTIKSTSDLLSNDFLFYYLPQPLKYINQATPSVTVKHLSTKTIAKIPFPLPPRNEQERIVARVEELFEKLDAAEEKLRAVVEGSPARRAALLRRAFTGDLTKNWRAAHGRTMDEWEKKNLGDCLFPQETKRPSGKTFRYIDIDAIDNKAQCVRAPKVLKTTEAPSRASRGLHPNDIVFSMVRPYLKNIAYIDSSLADCIASTGFYVCQCREMLYPRYLYYFLCAEETIHYLMQYMKGDNSPSIRKDDFALLPIPLPPLDEQKEIVRLLDELLAREEAARAAADAALAKIPALRQAVLARAFRGALGTNDPAEPPALSE